MRRLVFATAAAIAVLTAAAAQATTVTSVQGPDGAGQTILFDFESGTPAGLSGNAGVKIGTVAGQYAAPMGDSGHFLVVPVGGSTGSGILELGNAYDNISFYWGSIDKYNTVEFFTGAGATGTSLGLYGGGDLAGATGNGAQGTAANNRRVFFDFGSDLATSVRFSSTQIAFEIDNIATAPVPEPAMWAMMLVGFGFVGATLRGRRPLTVAA